MQRPIALTIMTLTIVLGGVYGLLVGIFLLQPKYMGETTNIFWLMFCVAVMLASTILILVGIGLWRKRNWARWAAVVMSLCGLVSIIINAVYRPSSLDDSLRGLSITIAQIAFDLWVVVYLLRSRMRSLFKPPSAA
jgi:uncharacterized membrane protein (DUF2068 family)